MGRVVKLPRDVVALIAAGEVIERPASVVKELIENSLDADATTIDIVIENGGFDLISVSDDGHGILREDCPTCVKRHSTSKIRTREDVEAIRTYGFRGEALASIAAVATLRIVTRAREEDIGTELVVLSGTEQVIRPASRAVGTTVEVTGLFERVPARRHSLMGPVAEAGRVTDLVRRYAAARPDVGLRLTRDGETLMDCPAGQKLSERIVYLWGHTTAAALAPVNHSVDNIRVTGYVVRPPLSRGNRSREYVSVRGRPIEDLRLSRAAEAAYATLLMRGRYPAFVIDIQLPPEDVDVNVHPSKREVLFANVGRVVEAVHHAIRRALAEEPDAGHKEDLSGYVTSAPPEVQHDTPMAISAGEAEAEPERSDTGRTGRLADTRTFPTTIVSESLEDPEQHGPEVIDGLFEGGLRIVGQIHGLYILLEASDGLVIVDQHAAHERVVYERLRREVNEGNVAVQELLEPVVLQLSPDEIEQIQSVSDVLHQLGFDVERFGEREVIVRTLPEILGKHASETDLVSLVDEILEVGKSTPVEHFMDEVVKVTACHSAIRAGRTLNHNEIARLLEEMAKTPDWDLCPHGRPTVIRVTGSELERRFGRTG